MNPFLATLLTLLQWAGSLVVFVIALYILVDAINRIVHNYFACKTAHHTMSQATAPSLETMFRAFQEAKRGTHAERDEQETATGKP